MNAHKIVNLIDALVFSALIFFASLHYLSSDDIFTIVMLTSMLYVALRKPDINTLTLVAILFATEAISALVIQPSEQISGYQLHGTLVLINLMTITAITIRPTWLAKHGPDFMACNPNLVTTRQDIIMRGLFIAHTVWQLAQLLEHMFRHVGDFGFGQVFDQWKPMFFYDIYKEGQLVFYSSTLSTLYFMTFNRSKHKSKKARHIVTEQ